MLARRRWQQQGGQRQQRLLHPSQRRQAAAAPPAGSSSRAALQGLACCRRWQALVATGSCSRWQRTRTLLVARSRRACLTTKQVRRPAAAGHWLCRSVLLRRGAAPICAAPASLVCSAARCCCHCCVRERRCPLHAPVVPECACPLFIRHPVALPDLPLPRAPTRLACAAPAQALPLLPPPTHQRARWSLCRQTGGRAAARRRTT